MSNDDDAEIEFGEFNGTLLLQPQKMIITFHGEDQEVLGTLTEDDDGDLTFSGNTDESAAIFFRDIVTCNSKHIREQNEVIDELQEQVDRLSAELRAK